MRVYFCAHCDACLVFTKKGTPNVIGPLSTYLPERSQSRLRWPRKPTGWPIMKDSRSKWMTVPLCPGCLRRARDSELKRGPQNPRRTGNGPSALVVKTKIGRFG